MICKISGKDGLFGPYNWLPKDNIKFWFWIENNHVYYNTKAEKHSLSEISLGQIPVYASPGSPLRQFIKDYENTTGIRIMQMYLRAAKE